MEHQKKRWKYDSKRRTVKSQNYYGRIPFHQQMGHGRPKVVDIPTELIGEDYVLMRIIGKADVITDDLFH